MDKIEKFELFKLYILSTFVILIFAFVFFRPDYSIVHIDDLFFAPWAIEFAQTARHYNPLIADYFPDLVDLQLQPRLHIIISSWFLSLFGTDSFGLILFQAFCYIACAYLSVTLFLLLGSRIAACFSPVFLVPIFALTGFRIELTGAAFWLAGLVVLIFLASREETGQRQLFSLQILSKTLLAIAPLSAPSIFAWSLGVIIAMDVALYLLRKISIRKLLICNSVALSIAVIVFLFVIGFEVEAFWKQFWHHASGTTGGGANIEALGRSVLFLVMAFILFRRRKISAILLLSIAAGQLLAAWLHDKMLIRNIASTIAILTFFSSMTIGFSLSKIAPAYLVASLIFPMDLYLFYTTSSLAKTDYQSVRETIDADRSSGKRILIDEPTAHHALNYETHGLLAWSWSKAFPNTRPASINELQTGTVWYLSKYRLFGYLKGHGEIAGAIDEWVQYNSSPYFLCALGRNSCRLPAHSWGIMRWERKSNGVEILDFDNGKARLFEAL